MQWPVCISDEAQEASAAVPTMYRLCISDEAQEASHASGTWVSSCVCIH
ncbi:MAG: hypothetical protein P8Q36_04360 [Alphaproteobacteria bacterium]|nr:hypothetical protein [Rhodospirillaceae bacterium]MBT6511897.1 hypothetical protein [Rhodospirillaceae bacterium]MBT7612438.1 hypothetical protein [Rhodospirillaceae bacterium]MBT7645503.1 hypothetical protein [Rhodospirillaceae bacterium]MDG2480089.1 hypothetical protein [Alphaproteobacteria bacterium]